MLDPGHHLDLMDGLQGKTADNSFLDTAENVLDITTLCAVQLLKANC